MQALSGFIEWLVLQPLRCERVHSHPPSFPLCVAEMRSGRSQMQRPKEAASLSWRRGGDRERARDDRRDGDRARRQGEERRDDGRGSDRGKEAAGERGGDGGGGRGRGASWRDRPPRDPLGRRGDSDALKAAAAELNQFSGDGSFLEQFQQLQAGREAQQAQQGDEETRPAAGAEVQPSASSGSEEGEERVRDAAQQGQRQSMAAAMAAERASLGVLPPGGTPTTGGAAAAEPALGGRGGSAEDARASGGGGGVPKRPAGNLSAAAMLRARLTGKAPPAEPVPAARPSAAAAGHEEGGLLCYTFGNPRWCCCQSNTAVCTFCNSCAVENLLPVFCFCSHVLSPSHACRRPAAGDCCPAAN